MSNDQKEITQGLIENLYRRYGAAVQRRAYAILGSRDAAADATQEVFVLALRAYDRFRGDSSPMTWLHRVTTNHCLNRLRNERRRGELDAELQSENSASGRRLELTPDLRRVLQSLPDDVAAAGLYYYLDGMTHEEIAGLLQVSRRTVGNWVEKFEKQFRKRLS